MKFCKTLSFALITSLIIISSGCDQKTNSHFVNELQQQQKKIAQLEEQQARLVKNDQLIANVISKLDEKQQALTYTEFDPSQTPYFILSNGAIALAGHVLSIDAVNDGSVIHISLVNLLSIPLSNLQFQMTWGNEKPQEKKDLNRWQQLLFSKNIGSTIQLLPGQWKNIDLTLKGISPNNLKYLKMSLTLDDAIFGNTSTTKPENKRPKK